MQKVANCPVCKKKPFPYHYEDHTEYVHCGVKCDSLELWNRHAHATQALAHGADIKAVSQNMGHADTTMIHKHYQHVLVKQREEALAVIPNLVIQSGNTNDHISTDICITKVEEIKVKQ